MAEAVRQRPRRSQSRRLEADRGRRHHCRSESRRRMEKAMADPIPAKNQPTDDTTGPKFQIGQILQNQWRIERLLSKGSFGVVYEAMDISALSMKVAVKTEPIAAKLPLLRLELAVMIAVQGKSNRVVTLYSAGHTHDLNYIVMSLLGKTLMELKKATPDDRFKLATVLRLSKEMLISLGDMHKAGFLHRDVKPSNFAIEHESKEPLNRGLVYIFDFGLCRQYVNPSTGVTRDARVSVPFRGTVRYASVDVLSGKDMGRHDDLWSLLYVLAEMLNSQLPWRRVVEKDKVRAIKQSTLATDLWQHFPSETQPFLKHLEKLEFYDTPNYDLMITAFDNAMARVNVNEKTPYDWEKPAAVVTPRKSDHDGDNEDDRSLASQQSIFEN